MKVLVTGATGLIGRNLCRSLTNDGHSVAALSRSPEKVRGLSAAKIYKWDPLVEPPPAEALQDLDSVVHLAGEPIADRRWSAAQKKRIRDSRVVSTRNLVVGLRGATVRPASLISGSAVGFYGDRGDEEVHEDSEAGTGFLTDTCLEWEGEAERASGLSMRVVRLRTGVVLSAEGGALKKMLPAFKLGAAGPLGSGKQWFPWIHIADMVGIIRHAIFNASLSGPINAVAPGAATNAEFTRELARVLHRPAFMRVPEFALRLLVGEMADALLGSQRVLPVVAQKTGYKFEFSDLRSALDDLLGGKRVAGAEKGRTAGA
ncbi:MAG TPA: TIGR01777 family oxidoreductase [Blastocatellia bacterium]|nr:TIGR01777 family oxidoreductase [Blastocatellia bacterium]